MDGLPEMSWFTILSSTSPAPSNPDIAPIQECLGKMREQIKDVPIIIMCDGVYDELKYDMQPGLESKTGASEERLQERTANYEEYKKRLIPWCSTNDIQIMVFPEHTHRANMTREALRFVQTPAVMPLDHDSYVMGNPDWVKLRKAMEDPRVNSIRFYYFEQVHPQHAHLVRYPVQIIEGVPLLPTIQYGDQPNIQRTEFLKGIIERYIGKNDKCFVEQKLWQVCHNDGWDAQERIHKLWLYAPENMACHYTMGIRTNWPMAIPFVEYPC